MITLIYIFSLAAAPPIFELPELQDKDIPLWVWYMFTALLVVTALFLAYYVSYRLYGRRMTRKLRRSNDRLSLILNTSKVHVWKLDIDKQMVTSIEPDGKRPTFPLSPNFGKNYVIPEHYKRLCRLLDEMANQKKDRETLELQAISNDDMTTRIFSVNLSVLNRDKSGKPTGIVGSTTDVTNARRRQQQQKDTMLRYQHIFNSAMVDTVSYDEHGFIDDLNEKATKAIGDTQRIIDAHISVQSVLGTPDLKLEDLEHTYLTQIYRSADDERVLNRILKRDELYYELQLVPIRNDDGRLLGIYGTGRDVTETAKTYSRLQKDIARLQEANDELQEYVRNLDYVMKNGGVRIVNYSPDTHTLTVYSETDHVQHKLTQTRLLSLAAEESKKTALRIMNNMDDLTKQPVKAVIKSTLRVAGQASKHDDDTAATVGKVTDRHVSGNGVAHYRPLYLHFSFVPVMDAKGHVIDYFGLCRDISDIKATEEQLTRKSEKAQEVETVKNAFLRNMCYEIRTPLNSVIGFAELIENNPNADDEHIFIEEIKKNTRSLLVLVNNILLLSRLDASMIEFKPEPVNFTTFFKERCQSAWLNCQQPGVDYIVETPYEHLMLDIDMSNVGIVIDQMIANAVRHTTSGSVRARFDYNGEDLTMAFQDTGCGIPDNLFDSIFERFVTTHSGNSGLGLPICKEVVKLMGGRIHLKSEVGKGTVFWVIIPLNIEH